MYFVSTEAKVTSVYMRLYIDFIDYLYRLWLPMETSQRLRHYGTKSICAMVTTETKLASVYIRLCIDYRLSV